MNRERLQQIQTVIKGAGCQGIVLLPGANMVYLSGIHAHLSERPIVLFIPAAGEVGIVIPLLEAPKAEAAGITQIFSWTDETGYEEAFAQAIATIAVAACWAVEAFTMRLFELEIIKRHAPSFTTVHAEPYLSQLRMVKDEAELAAMQKAAVVAETALERLLPQIKIGMSEKRVAQLLVHELQQAGSEGNPFGPIVSAGPNSASPHAVPTDRPLQAGDLLVLDWGAIVDGYPSDITRTFAVGEISDELKKIYELVRLANEAGKAVVKAGTTGAEVDFAAREQIEQGGYGAYFIHRTGHGLGLEVHEPPYMMAANKEGLGVGMVFTVEPGIYLPGKGGVRIEDDIVVTEEGWRSLSSYPRTLQLVG